jgi:hypothetical protein
MTDAGLEPDPWQAELLRTRAGRILLLAGRQVGKSTAVAALVLVTALLEAPALVLILSPTLRQSGEFFRDKLLRLYNALGRPGPATRQTALTLELANGSRIISLPDNEEGIRGYSGVNLLVIDEAARVGDLLYHQAARPMLAVSSGRLVCLSTPFGRRGFFFEAWEGRTAEGKLLNAPWERYRITAHQCPRIPPEFLEEERQSKTAEEFAQEYECSFESAEGCYFRVTDIERMIALGQADRPFWES